LELRQSGGAHLNIFVVFADAIYARGLQVSLAELPDVDEVHYAVGVTHAWAKEELHAADVVLLDHEVPGAAGFAHDVVASCGARVLLCTRRSWNEELVHAAGEASGVLAAELLTPEMVAVAVRAISLGLGVLGIDLLQDLCRERQPSQEPRNGDAADEGELLTQREHAVLSLVAEGVPSREIAHRLAYSERTIKNVLHDAVTKLGARSRSHAVAMAVRERII
jgi:DNA-binding NarL/FixJ family response regulator